MDNKEENFINEVKGYGVEGVVDPVRIFAVDLPGPAGGQAAYMLNGFDTKNRGIVSSNEGLTQLNIFFQNAAPVDGVPNGVTMEHLLAVCAHRLVAFQAGQFANVENAMALRHIQAAILSLNDRTIDRVNRGVKNTPQK